MMLQAKLTAFLLVLSTVVIGLIITVTFSYPLNQTDPLCKFYADGNEVQANNLGTLVQNVNAALPQEISFTVTKSNQVGEIKISLADIGANYVDPTMVAEIETYFNTNLATSYLQKIENDRLTLMSYIDPNSATSKTFSFSVATLNFDYAKLNSQIAEKLSSIMAITDEETINAVTNFVNSNIKLGKLNDLSMTL